MRFATILRCTGSIMAFSLSNAALAQAAAAPAPAAPESADVTDDTIVVTGIRESLASSQALKRNAPQVIDAVVAEDIGKLPDLAVSDTAARIPGVQVVRTGGEASRVLIRGLPDFATTYNGREIFTAETRVVALQDFPSANIAALEVFKTSSANLVEPGLAGLVNVRSRRPFDFQDGQIAGTVWGLYSRQSDKFTPNGNFLITKRWDTGMGEMGLLLNASYTEFQYLDSEPSNTDFIADPTINGQGVRLPDIQRLFYRSGNRVRPSGNAAFQWKPTPELEIYLEGLYQGFRNKVDDRLLDAPLYGGATYSNIVLRSGTNLVQSGTVTGLGNRPFGFQGGTYNKTNTYQFAGGMKYNNGPFHLTADAARTRSTFTGSTESIDRVLNVGPGTSVDFDLSRPQFNLRGIDANNPANYTFQGLYEENQRSAGQDWQARIDGQYDFEGSFLRNIQVGARYTNRDAQRSFGSRYAFLLPLNINASTLPVTYAVFDGGFNGTNTQPFRNFTAPTYDSIRANLTQLRQFIIANCPNILPTDPGNGCAGYTVAPVAAALQYNADEETLAGYGQINFGFGDDFDGTIGLRAVRTKVRVAPSGPVQSGILGAGQEFTDYLPNASLRWRITPQIQLRLAATQTRTRPNFADLNPTQTLGQPVGGGTVGTALQPYTGGGGNPFLQPFKSNNYDATAEYYFSKTGFASLAVFRRDLDGFIQNRAFTFTDPTLGVVRLTVPVNTGKGKIDGAEAQVQAFLDYDFLPDWAHGFGIQANVTYLNAKTQQDDGTGTGNLVDDRILGVSKWGYNIAGLYDRGGFSARVTYNGRSRYLDLRQPRGNEAGLFYREFAKPADRLDLSLNYDILPQATVFFDFTNITRKPFRVDFSSARDGAPRADYVRFLRYEESTLSLGLRFRFGK